MKWKNALGILFDCIIPIKLKKFFCNYHKTNMFYGTALMGN